MLKEKTTKSKSQNINYIKAKIIKRTQAIINYQIIYRQMIDLMIMFLNKIIEQLVIFHKITNLLIFQ